MTRVDPANILVFCMIASFVFLTAYLAIQSRIKERKSKKEQEAKK